MACACMRRHLPLAKDLVRSSRQQLVAHLDGYAKRHRPLFEKVKGAVPLQRPFIVLYNPPLCLLAIPPKQHWPLADTESKAMS